MTQDQILGFVRHALTLVGGIFITKGWVDETTLTQLVGALSILIGFGWSLYTNHLSPPPAPAPSPATTTTAPK